MDGTKRLSVEKIQEDWRKTDKRLFTVAGRRTFAAVSSPCGAHKGAKLHEIYLQGYWKGTNLFRE